MKLMKLLGSLVLLLAACAPAVVGSDSRSPILVSVGETLEVVRGSEVYVSLEFTPGQLGLQPADLSGAFWIPAGVDSRSANLAGRVGLEEVRVPANWQLDLARVRAEHEMEVRFGQETGEESYLIRPVFRVQVPTSAQLGVTEITARLTARGGTGRDLSIPVRVRLPDGN